MRNKIHILTILGMHSSDGKNCFTEVARVRHRDLHAHDTLSHAARAHGASTLTTVTSQGASSELTYASLSKRAASCAHHLRERGIGSGDHLANIGLSSADQLAWLYGALSIGAVSHLVNPQHPVEDIVQLMQRANPKVILNDAATQPLAHALSSLGIHPPAIDMAERFSLTAPAHDAAIAEDAPAFVCYSSGTTGLPKAVQYTHRSTVLHALACALPDAMGLSAQDRVMPLMQVYHATAWGAPFVCPLVGAALILVPPVRDPACWFRWIEDHRITVLGGVSAHWMALAQHMQRHNLRFSTLRRTVIAGSRLPPQVAQFIAQGLGVEVCHAWGMTETSPLATIERYSDGDALKHGKPVFGVELAVRTETEDLASEGCGELRVRGHWVAHREPNDDAWLSTGDLARLRAWSHLEVIDRLDEAVMGVNGSISSALVEYQARTVHGVADAALLAPQTAGEQCTLVWVRNTETDPQTIEKQLSDRFAAEFDGWSPDRYIAVDALPYTPSAKVQKRILREQITAQHSPSAPLAEAHSLPPEISPL